MMIMKTTTSGGSGSCSETREGGPEMAKREKDENPYVKCPYYKCETGCVIYCEGVQKDCSIHMAFATRQQKMEYQNRLCKSEWKNCMIAQAQNRRYDY